MASKPDVIRIALVGDLRLSVPPAKLVSPADLAGDADLMVVVGNIGSGSDSVYWCGLSSIPTVFVPGVLEYSCREYATTAATMKAMAIGFPHVTVLDDATAHFNFRGTDVRVIGGTLWSDFLLFGPERRDECMRAARESFAYNSDINIGMAKPRPWAPKHAIEAFKRTVDYIASELAAPYSGITLVATHTAPTKKVVPATFETDPIAATCHSNLDDLFPYVDAWLCQTWDPVDLRFGRCRVISNGRGDPCAIGLKPKVYEISGGVQGSDAAPSKRLRASGTHHR